MPDPNQIPLSLYIHVPWCVRKCPYCDFNSHEYSEQPEQAYLAALIDDLRQDAPMVAGRPVRTVFIGGGTPSLMSGDFYQQLLDAVRSELDLATDAEITLEANPGTVEQARFDAYRAAGINRLSIGVQSFDAEKLAALGRIHGRDEALQAVASARRAGFDNINLDLMHALPGQTPEQALDDLRQAIELAPTHLSWYELTIEPNTAFWSRPPLQPDSDQMADTEQAGFALLAAAGFERYEISAFARPGHACRHNLNYWEFGDYLALGAGAHGKLTSPDGQILRYQKTRKPADYLAQPARTRGRHFVEPADLPLEFLLNSLRLVAGTATSLFPERTGLPLATLSDFRRKNVSERLLLDDDQRLACTPLGLSHLNRVLGHLDS